MKISFINLAIFLVILVGVIVHFSYGNIFGDAQNFRNYYLNLDQGFENNIYLAGQFNTIFITFIYGFLGPFSPFIVNSSILLILKASLNHLKIFKINSSLETIEEKKYLLILLIFFFLIFNPSLYLRFLEPSREFSQLPFSLLLGISLGRKSSNLLRLFFLVILILGRPIYIFILGMNILICKLLVETGFKFNQKKLILSLFLFVFIFFVTLAIKNTMSIFSFTQDIEKIYFDLAGNYMSVDRGFLPNMILNIIGGFNSFLTVGDIYTKAFFFFDYITRITIFILSYRVFKNNFLIFTIAGSFVLTLLTFFPHPRYFQPSYYYAIGYFSSYYLSYMQNKPKYN